MRRTIGTLWGSERAAVAPTVALSLFGLIAAGGIAFDYARMASMDTELQGAADQAALAAAGQLDGEAGACSRAANAATSLITNRTLMANDAGGTTVSIASETACDASGSIRFYKDIAKAVPATNDANAKFVEVQVNPRTATFALTPIVGAVTSGAIDARAFAGIGEAMCRVPPLMMCNPRENTDPTFTAADYVGKGIRLVANDGGGNYGPGNFGFLDVFDGGSGAALLRAALGRQGEPGNCARGSGVTTEPGNMIAVRDALNTRFDIYDNGLNQACGNSGALCPPSRNSRKDLFRRNNGCGFVTGGGGNGWREDTTRGYPPAALTTARNLTAAEIANLGPMGYPRDKCHAVSVAGTCADGLIGNRDWDRFAYFRSHALTTPASWPEAASITTTAAMNTFMQTTFGTTTPSRYQVYAYEMANPATRLRTVAMGGNLSAAGGPVCGTGAVTPGENTVDRRIMSVAVINCTAEGVHGRTANVKVTKWIDIFLVEPAVRRARTENGDVYVEIVGEAPSVAEGVNYQLVQKAVPYLIQ